MLSETYLLHKALEETGIVPPQEHPRVKSPGRSAGPCIRVCLGSEGQVTDIVSVTEQEWPGLWTVRDGNKNSFPVIRIKNPVVSVPRGDALWEQLGFEDSGKRKKQDKSSDQSRRDAMAQALTSCSGVEVGEWQNLCDKAAELRECFQSNDEEGDALREFASRFTQAAKVPGVLLEAIANRALESLKQARIEDLDAIELLVVGKGPPDAQGRQPDMTVQLAFDLAEETLYTREIKDRVKRILPAERDAPTAKHPARHCSFTGEATELQTAAFPKVMLPVLNKEFPLVSMFSDAACNTRYGLTDAFVVPVAKEAALRMQDALALIVDRTRRGRTWRGVASGRFEVSGGRKRETSDLLIVYVDGKPDIEAQLADLFGSDPEGTEKQFEADAKTVCDALNGIEHVNPGSRLNLFLLRKASEGQAHVAVAESPSVTEVLDAAQRWQEGANNIPEITVPLPPESKGGHAVQGRSRSPYPDQVVRLLTEQWVTSGTDSRKVQGISLGQVLDVMLHKPGCWEEAASHILELSAYRLGPLLVGLFGALHASAPRLYDDYPPRSREIALRAVSVLGILLHAFNRRKEDYMTGTAFLVGRLLSLADTLHREYCEVVRDKSIPPQLFGNSLMPVAADNPQDAVDRLRERMNTYKAWANKADGEKKDTLPETLKAIRIAKWAVAQMGEVCRQLAEQLPLPTQTDSAFRAELFLGYMARSPKAESGGIEAATDDDESEEGGDQ
ncbi:MAG: hypothetical protein HY318_08575 [Armatimonadetes bacterium]|nr:hypothetical protein [Armatimonadota bacterium]